MPYEIRIPPKNSRFLLELIRRDRTPNRRVATIKRGSVYGCRLKVTPVSCEVKGDDSRRAAGVPLGRSLLPPIRFSSDHNGVAVMKRTLTSVDFAPPVTAPRIRTFGKKSRKFFSF